MTSCSLDTNHLLLTLSNAELCRAARLAGYPIALDERPIDEADLSDELLRYFAKKGIINAIHEQFERDYPTRYPEDVDIQNWQTNSAQATGVFSNIWRGKASW
ncbi:MAG: hypothetical protein ABJO57_10070 [Lentilitoribacter sp.]